MPADWFTGTVWQDPIIETPERAACVRLYVRFEPGARTNWHTHPLGQTLYIVSGTGRVQTWGGTRARSPCRRRGLVSARREALARRRSGHDHGAHRHAEVLDGKIVDWLEKVTDEQYKGT